MAYEIDTKNSLGFRCRRRDRLSSRLLSPLFRAAIWAPLRLVVFSIVVRSAGLSPLALALGRQPLGGPEPRPPERRGSAEPSTATIEMMDMRVRRRRRSPRSLAC